MANERPLVLVDLDDTLFQTARKMPANTARHPASYDVDGGVSGYQSAVQKALLDWLLATADVVPVTARSAEAFSRVRLGFTRGAVCAHGGLILDPEGGVDKDWHALMGEVLAPFHERLPELCETALGLADTLGVSLRGWVVEEADQRHYVVIKHNSGSDHDLQRVLEALQTQGLLTDLHSHRNGNNLALLPVGLCKRAAVQHYLARDRRQHGERLVLGFGDSITDLGFMNLCDFWATPSRSQLAAVVQEHADD
ncbi:trehalose phosphatase [Pseudomonas sp. RP23018S]|uniref:trehalose phosphatase n=1 Tax=Pseudomonas sp. RP23018S TaxID=3096037 RepID=UPI002ACAFFC9|nr:trehalose phosphatase [Pseudomonas sp. RP23018S]MDZ5603656.1 trehalose phosphatase [Pseudomonas sp. RP23018S]